MRQPCPAIQVTSRISEAKSGRKYGYTIEGFCILLRIISAKNQYGPRIFIYLYIRDKGR